MTTADMQTFGDNIQARWQETGVLSVGRAYDLCKRFDLAGVLSAMDKLKLAMNTDHLILDPDRLAAVCMQMHSGNSWQERTTRALANARESAALAEAERGKTYSGELTPEIDAQAEEACAGKYDATWGGFSAEVKTKLKKAWAKGGFPK